MDFMEISRRRVTVCRFAQPQRILVLDTSEDLAKVKAFCTFGYDRKYVDAGYIRKAHRAAALRTRPSLPSIVLGTVWISYFDEKKARGF